jgi:hypothetical protein
MPFIQKGYDRTTRIDQSKRPPPSALGGYSTPQWDESEGCWVSLPKDSNLPSMKWDGEKKAWKESVAVTNDRESYPTAYVSIPSKKRTILFYGR